MPKQSVTAQGDKTLGISRQQAHEGGKVVSPTTPSAFAPSGYTPGIHIC